MSVTEMLPGWTVAREISSDVLDGLNRGTYVLHGGVIRSAPSTDGAGQIVRHLLPTGQDLPDSVSARSVFDLTLARTTQDVLNATTGIMLLSGMNVAVTAVGFGVLYKKLTELQKGLSEIKESVDGIVRLLELDNRAKLMFALDELHGVTRNGPPGKREEPSSVPGITPIDSTGYGDLHYEKCSRHQKTAATAGFFRTLSNSASVELCRDLLGGLAVS